MRLTLSRGGPERTAIASGPLNTTTYLVEDPLGYLLRAGSSFRGSSRAVNRLAQTVGAEDPQHHTIDEDRRRASNTIHLTIADVMLDLCRVNSVVKFAVKLRSIKTKLTCIFLKRRHVEGFLPLK